MTRSAEGREGTVRVRVYLAGEVSGEWPGEGSVGLAG